ncbi:MAG: type II toxin-antitoxin system HicB family antitoxin [Candidatus Aminicenantes bacterium]|nr:type II toxin-antitoxin system HicB family antitoxin [Candidatus Aminicenantes bacterium]
MPIKTDRYTYKISWSEEDQDYIGLCVEFPSLSWLAASQQEALDGVRKVVADVVQDMISKREFPPPPLSGKKFSGKFMVRIPPGVHRRLAIQAAEEGISLNRLVSDKLTRH